MKTLLLSALLVFVVLAIFGSLVPFDFTPMPFDEAAARIATALTAAPSLVSRIDFASNVILFIPIGVLLTGYLAIRRSRASGDVVDVWITLLVCVALSSAIEAVQVFLPSRTVSSSDIMGETLGGLIGAGVWILAGGLVWRACDRQHRKHQPHAPLTLVLLTSYLLLYAASQWLPFDITLEPSELGAKFRAGHIMLMPFTAGWTPTSERVTHWFVAALATAPLGALLVWFARRGHRTAALALGLVYVAAVEAVQILIVSRTADSTDVLIGGIGLLAGAAVAARMAPDASPCNKPALVAAAVWVGGLASSGWSPFNFSFDPEMTSRHWASLFTIPFFGYFATSEWNAFVNLAQKMVLVVPLGFLVGVGFRTDQARSVTPIAAAVVVMGLLLFVVEVGQVYLPGRAPDITDVIIGTLAGTAGIAVVASCPSAFRPKPACASAPPSR